FGNLYRQYTNRSGPSACKAQRQKSPVTGHLALKSKVRFGLAADNRPKRSDDCFEPIPLKKSLDIACLGRLSL
ncbi:hypothetical protein, partial [uncultured Roseobacter sp.]|uniref:hypothetical protein n=1 Tax=uncultured Roseobacter sp. TaxID=114847 RepID=UPI00261BF21B